MPVIKPAQPKKRLIINDNDVIFWQHDDKNYALHITRDEYPSNPRKDQDNIASMWCQHRSYALGDFDGDMPIEKWLVDMLKTLPEKDLAEWLRNNMLRWTTGSSDHEIVSSFCDMVLENDDNNWKHGMQALRAFAVVLPLWLYDHTGITISVGERVYPYNDRWDSGQVGFIALTKYKTMEELRDIVCDEHGEPIRIPVSGSVWRYKVVPYTEETWKQGAIKTIKAEVETYDQYLTDDVWFYQLYSMPITPDGKLNENADDWDEEDSCGGFYGDDMLENGILDNVGCGLDEAIKANAYKTGSAEVHTVTYLTFNCDE